MSGTRVMRADNTSIHGTVVEWCEDDFCVVLWDSGERMLEAQDELILARGIPGKVAPSGFCFCCGRSMDGFAG